MYAGDSSDDMPVNDAEQVNGMSSSTSNSWVTGNCIVDTNPTTITSGTLYPYVKNAAVYKCPADLGFVQGTSIPKLRSFSLSCYMNGPAEANAIWGVVPLNKTAQIQISSQTLTFIDEDDLTIDDGHFLYSPTINDWLNLPTWRHQNGDVLAFADGHVEYWKWRSAHPASTYFDGGGNLTDPVALQDLNRLQGTAPATN